MHYVHCLHAESMLLEIDCEENSPKTAWNNSLYWTVNGRIEIRTLHLVNVTKNISWAAKQLPDPTHLSYLRGWKWKDQINLERKAFKSPSTKRKTPKITSWTQKRSTKLPPICQSWLYKIKYHIGRVEAKYGVFLGGKKPRRRKLLFKDYLSLP